LAIVSLPETPFVLCDKIDQWRNEYSNCFAFRAIPANGVRTMTLPFDGGLELSVRR
jgi:hypothetical protein